MRLILTRHIRALAWAAFAATAVFVGQEQPPLFAETADTRSADGRLAGRIEDELRKDRRIHWELLEVNVHDGKAELFGRVKTDAEKALATTIASTVPGVASVSNQILVQQTLSERRVDEDRKALEGIHGPTPF